MPPRPSAAHLVFTWRCNLRCQACDAWKRPSSAEELTVPQWDRVLSQVSGLDIVKIIGGEPFERPDLADLVRTIRRRVDPFVLQLVTNGTRRREAVSLIRREAWPGLHLRVSLHGLGSEAHDRARGVTGAYCRAEQTLEALAAARDRHPFVLAVNFTVTDESYPHLAPLLARCRALGVDLVPGFAVKPFLRHADLEHEEVSTVGVRDPKAVLPGLLRSDHGARRGFTRPERWFMGLANRGIFNNQAKGGEALRFRCRELRDLAYFDPQGNLITCGLRQEPVGNLLRRPFDEVWRSPRSDHYRRQVDRCDGCMQGAVELMSRIYHGR